MRCRGPSLQVRQLLKLQEQFEISEAARQAQHVGNAGVIADLTATNHQLEAQVTSLTRQLEQSLTKQHRTEDLKATQEAQRAATDASNAEDIASLTHVNGQLMSQVAEYRSRLEQAQAQLQGAENAVQADNSRGFSDNDHLRLQEQIGQLTEQLQQAQAESSTQSLQMPDGVSGGDTSTAVNESSSLSRQLEQTQHELVHPQDSSAAQHAQQLADSAEEITDLITANSSLLQQLAERQEEVVQAQHEAEAAIKQLHHMRELVKAQHAKREEHAVSLQAQLESLQVECQAKDKQARLLRQLESMPPVCLLLEAT